ncbi:MAG TPA: TonB-dependent receptor plug domain-containing protein, partial [Chitinophagaceae bacterium]
MERKIASAAIAGKLPRLLALACIILLQLLALPGAHAQTKVAGRILDAKENPLEGVTVTLKGTSVATTTDANGLFNITVPNEKAVLIFSFVGYDDKEEIVGKRTFVNAALSTKTSDLDQVIVVGYGTQRKRDVTGAISSVSSKTIEEKQPTNIFDALQGAAPGVRVMTTSGAPGDDADITIRGISTLSDEGVRPLYIVDGVPMRNISIINPKDIQSIEILKDAASAAIYGSRSANGVIIITTKRGEEGKPTITFDYLRSSNRLSNRISQANRLERQMFDRRGNLGLDPKPDDSTSFSRNSDNDYQDLITQTAIRNQFDFGIRGGTKTLNYFNSVQYLDETGIIINSFNKRLSIRTNVEYRPSQRLSMFTRFNFSYQKRNNINEGN